VPPVITVFGCGRNRRARFFQQLHRLFIHAQDGHLGIVRFFIGFQHLFHVGDKFAIRFWWDYPVFDLPIRHAIFFNDPRES
jgi:hypothetical protein